MKVFPFAEKSMEIEIWSDVRCPFCYIGKHKFEKALEKFEHKDKIKISWKSFELDPGLKTAPEINAQDHLAEVKGISKAQVDQMTTHVVRSAQEIGLKFNLEHSIVANSFNAHRLIQFAQSQNLGNEAEEALFKAHFTESTNIDDPDELQKIGEEIGLDSEETRKVLTSDAFSDKVRKDQVQAQTLGIRGVPFFVFDQKYAISGAQPTEIFLQAITESYGEFADKNNPFASSEGASCTVDGICD